RVEAVNRRGKFLLLPLSNRGGAGGGREATDLELIIHLGMTAAVAGEPPGGKAAGHVRVRLELDGTAPTTLYFIDPRRFGGFMVVPAGEYGALPTLRALGPEPLGDGFTAPGFHAALARSRRPIKAHLLSQRPVAG